MSDFHWQVAGALMLAIIGAVSHLLTDEHDRSFTLEMFFEMWRPRRKKPINSNLFYCLVGLAFGASLTGLAFGANGNYQIASWCFTGAWLIATLSSFVGCSIFSRRARIAWTVITCFVFGVAFLAAYMEVCPTLKISPSNVTFSAVGDLYTFRVENKSESDTYMNSFLFYLESSAYSTADFDFQILGDSRKPLGQQPDGVTLSVPDMFGAFGSSPESSSTHIFFLYAYHLKPHEFRELSVKLQQHEVSTNQAIPFSSKVMSYTKNTVPVSRDGISVYVPALMTESFDLSGFLVCYAKEANRPCRMLPSTNVVRVPEGCMSLAAISEKEQIPGKILPGKCN